MDGIKPTERYVQTSIPISNKTFDSILISLVK